MHGEIVLIIPKEASLTHMEITPVNIKKEPKVHPENNELEDLALPMHELTSFTTYEDNWT